jgi:hypothetical protein
LERRLRLHNLLKLLDAHGRIYGFGPIDDDRRGIETTLVNGRAWGYYVGGWSNGRTISIRPLLEPTEPMGYSRDAMGEYENIPFRWNGMWFARRLSSSGRHDYVALLAQRNGEGGQYILAAPISEFPADFQAAYTAAYTAWRAYDDNGDDPEPPVPAPSDWVDVTDAREQERVFSQLAQFMPPTGWIARAARLAAAFNPCQPSVNDNDEDDDDDDVGEKTLAKLRLTVALANDNFEFED